jgi:hypothetical protein
MYDTRDILEFIHSNYLLWHIKHEEQESTAFWDETLYNLLEA